MTIQQEPYSANVRDGWWLDVGTTRYRDFIKAQDMAFQERMREVLGLKRSGPVKKKKVVGVPPIAAEAIEPKEKNMIGLIVKRLSREREEKALRRDVIVVHDKPILMREADDTDSVSVRDIIRSVEFRHGLTPGEIAGARRNTKVVRARHEAMWIAKELHPHLSYPVLGRIFNRDHTTVLHALRKYEARMVEYRKDAAE